MTAKTDLDEDEVKDKQAQVQLCIRLRGAQVAPLVAPEEEGEDWETEDPASQDI